MDASIIKQRIDMETNIIATIKIKIAVNFPEQPKPFQYTLGKKDYLFDFIRNIIRVPNETFESAVVIYLNQEAKQLIENIAVHKLNEKFLKVTKHDGTEKLINVNTISEVYYEIR